MKKFCDFKTAFVVQYAVDMLISWNFWMVGSTKLGQLIKSSTSAMSGKDRIDFFFRKTM